LGAVFCGAMVPAGVPVLLGAGLPLLGALAPVAAGRLAEPVAAARSSCRHFSFSKARAFSHLLMPPIERGSTTGAGAVLPTTGAPDGGATTGFWDVDGVWDGVTAGV